MFKRYLPTALTILAVSLPAFAQGKGPNDRMPSPTYANTAFQGLFKPVIEAAAKSVVRVQVDGKDAALGTVVTSDGYLLTKASELKVGKVTIKTRDGRDFDAVLTATSDAYDLAVLKTDGSGLTPIKWASTSDAPVGNWIAVPGLGERPRGRRRGEHSALESTGTADPKRSERLPWDSVGHRRGPCGHRQSDARKCRRSGGTQAERRYPIGR